MRILLYACFVMHILAMEVQADAAASASARYIAFAIQGNLQAAPPLFESLPANGAPTDRELAARFRERFVDRTEAPAPSSGNALVDRVVATYRAYWRDTLMGSAVDAAAEDRLLTSLMASLQDAGEAVGERAPPDAYALLAPALQRQGFHALASQAAPLQDLFVWRRQEVDTFEVALPDQVRRVQVAFLSDFASLGWKHYASLGLATTTGWVDGDTLYCVEWAYAPGTENFDVSYLKHETQHLADFERFPGLSSAELEYRAKLTELAFASNTLRRLLDDFSAKGAPNPDSPHAEANWRVVRAVYEALYGEEPVGDVSWAAVDVGRVNRVARRLLAEDTARLEGRL